MADFADSLSQPDDDSVPAAESTHPFDGDDSYLHFDSFAANHHVAADSDGLQFSPEANGKSFNGGFGDTDGPILPPPSEMGAEEGFALLEWRRENAIRLEEKEKKERELLIQIMEEADEYKIDFYRRREITCENNKAANREKEKLSNAIHEKFHAEADKNYWKAIAELIPNEVPTIEKRGKKGQEKKPSVAVIQGPKPGKPTELSRMRQILLKLKHNTPPHLKHSPPAPPPAKDAKASGSTAAAPAKAAAVVSTSEAVAVA